MKVGIWGYGFVGQSTHILMNDDPIIYDIKTPYCKAPTILETDIIFVCVPTPMNDNGSFDSSIVTETLDNLVEADYRGVVIVKSTTLFSVLEQYQSKLNIVFNPEFLNQNTSFEDALNQKVIMIGGDAINTKKVANFYNNYTLIKDFDIQYMTLKQACDFKYTRNMYGALKVLFWEMIQDTTGNSRKMSDLYKMIPYNGESSQIGMDGFRGYGGACWPKDVSAWNQEHNHELTQTMVEYNGKLNEY